MTEQEVDLKRRIPRSAYDLASGLFAGFAVAPCEHSHWLQWAGLLAIGLGIYLAEPRHGTRMRIVAAGLILAGILAAMVF